MGYELRLAGDRPNGQPDPGVARPDLDRLASRLGRRPAIVSFSHYLHPESHNPDYSLATAGSNLITSYSYDSYGRPTGKVDAQRQPDRHDRLERRAERRRRSDHKQLRRHLRLLPARKHRQRRRGPAGGLQRRLRQRRPARAAQVRDPWRHRHQLCLRRRRPAARNDQGGRHNLRHLQPRGQPDPSRRPRRPGPDELLLRPERTTARNSERQRTDPHRLRRKRQRVRRRRRERRRSGNQPGPRRQRPLPQPDRRRRRQPERQRDQRDLPLHPAARRRPPCQRLKYGDLAGRQPT